MSIYTAIGVIYVYLGIGINHFSHCVTYMLELAANLRRNSTKFTIFWQIIHETKG